MAWQAAPYCYLWVACPKVSANHCGKGKGSCSRGTRCSSSSKFVELYWNKHGGLSHCMLQRAAQQRFYMLKAPPLSRACREAVQSCHWEHALLWVATRCILPFAAAVGLAIGSASA